MAAAVPFIIKAVASYAIGKIVGEITGNEILGAIAGGIAGAGMSGAFSGSAAGAGGTQTVVGGAGLASETMGSGILEAAGAAAPSAAGDIAGVMSAGAADVSGITSAATAIPTAGDIAGMTGQAAVSSAAAPSGITGLESFSDISAGSSGLGDVAMSGVTDIGTGAGAVTDTAGTGVADFFGSGAEVTPPPTPKEPGILSRGMDYLEEHPGLAEVGFKGLTSMFKPDEMEIAERKHELELEKMEKEEAMKTGADFRSIRDRNMALNQDLAREGYRPQAAIIRDAGYDQRYANREGPNITAIMDRIYNRQQEGQA